MNFAAGDFFEDGEHILYVNGDEYRGDSELGKLMHDLNCMRADNMELNLMAERTRYLKENPERVRMMRRLMEDMRNETWNKATESVALQDIRNLMETMKQTSDQAMDALKIFDNDRLKYLERL